MGRTATGVTARRGFMDAARFSSGKSLGRTTAKFGLVDIAELCGRSRLGSGRQGARCPTYESFSGGNDWPLLPQRLDNGRRFGATRTLPLRPQRFCEILSRRSHSDSPY
jgi:hypothetical protein